MVASFFKEVGAAFLLVIVDVACEGNSSKRLVLIWNSQIENGIWTIPWWNSLEDSARTLGRYTEAFIQQGDCMLILGKTGD